ncbi:Integral membrane protein TerC [Hydrogenobacter thermophilus TK-6]|uniref:Integral membrane protein n=1 Tax=Hydrogenobacter thermophilus (strain DSM 6534 / IAM 12695 / TK-6) TaxID=608538 RepID=D3DJX0_HYDTT|nr:TerC family protein [Hydrogenobacter thermophilus]ADO46043.1 Integral membrane protein TerC [Hydrogenobacter thermophilus TK-6]BAI70122.1 integral membrane protein [Hydrogenobacter thermophilus TK-6]
MMLDLSWFVFGSLVLIALFLDLFVFHRKPHKVSVKESLLLSLFWILIGLGFGLYVLYTKGYQPATEYITGYLLEKSLSLDNIFVFILIFSYFRVPDKYRHKILFWGVFGAILMRAVFIFTGIKLIDMFDWVIYVFGVILLVSAVKLLTTEEKEFHPQETLVYKVAKRILPMKPDISDGRFFVREGKKIYATPLFLTLLFVESSDLMFAIDSVPAILAISRDPFVVYTSNIFAILGLRSLYFAADAILPMFHYLHYGLAFILGFIGVKMLISDFYHIPVAVSLLLILSAVFVSMLASLVSKRMKG